MPVILPRPARTLAVLLLASAGWGSARAASVCEKAAEARQPGVTIAAATLVEAGTFQPPLGKAERGPSNADTYKALPAFCRVEAGLNPAPDSDIQVELWLPVKGWNGRLQLIGNGGYTGLVQYGDLAIGVTKGYAVAVSNSGHTSDHDKDFWIGHPDKVIDWETRAVHQTAVSAKAIVAKAYGEGPRHSYWNSCSTGGRQGWMEAEYYPEDFDGLAIGDPANPMTRLQATSIWYNLVLNRSTASFIPIEKWAMIHQTFNRDCDAKDGLKDGLVENPLACNFDPKRLLCKDADTAACLTQPQMEALIATTKGLVNSQTGEQYYPGFPLGSALLPGPIGGKEPDGSAPQTFRILLNDPTWDYHTYDVNTDTSKFDTLGYQKMNAVNPEKLEKLFARGGRIIMYHGWDDPAISPMIGLKLYNDAVAANGGVDKTYQSIRLFMIPGKSHCGNPFDQMDAITQWVEQGVAPDSVTVSYAADTKSDTPHPLRTRPVCAWPQVARYKGQGSVDEASSFSCVKPSA